MSVDAAKAKSNSLSAADKAAAKLLFSQGFVAFQAGRNDEAVALMVRGLEVDPADYKAHLILAQANERRKEGRYARHSYQAVVALAPSTAPENVKASLALQSMLPDFDCKPEMGNFKSVELAAAEGYSCTSPRPEDIALCKSFIVEGMGAKDEGDSYHKYETGSDGYSEGIRIWKATKKFVRQISSKNQWLDSVRGVCVQLP